MRSEERPDGSPIIPVPPPTTTTGRPPWRWMCRSPNTGTRCPDVERRPARVEPVVGVDRPARRPGARRARASRSWSSPRQASSASRPPGSGGPAVGAVTGGRREASERPDRGESCPCPALCYRDRRMQTSLARRRRHRRNGGRRGSGGAASKVAIALPLFLFGTFVLLAVVGATAAVTAYGYYSQGLDGPQEAPRRRSISPSRPRSTTGPARSSSPGFGAGQARLRRLRPDPALAHRRDDLDRGQDLLGERRVRPGRHRLGRARHRSAGTSAAPRRSPSSWSGRGSSRRAPSRAAATNARSRRSSSRSA